MWYRPYQLEAIDNTWDGFVRNVGNYHPIIAMPTGSGKSVVQAGFIYRAMREYNQCRFLCLTHVKELVKQNARKLQSFWPTAPVGVFSAGLGRKDSIQSIVFGGVQSVVNSISDFGWRDIVFIDECQMVGPSDTSMYQQVKDEMRSINPNVKFIGLSATPYRTGQGLLTDAPTRGGERLFTDIVYDITGVDGFNMLLDDHYLSPLIPKPTDNFLRTEGLELIGGDFKQNQSAEEIRNQKLIERAVVETMDLSRGRRCFLTFASGVENTRDIADKFSRYMSTTFVHSNTPDYKMSNDERDNRIEGFKEGRYQMLVVNNIGTVGFDHPAIDCIVDLRPTTSVVFHIQKYGRGTRPFYHPNWSWDLLREKHHRRDAIAASVKHNCLVLDFCTNTKRLGPINAPEVPKPPKEKKCRECGGKLGRNSICVDCETDNKSEPALKICPQCRTYNYASARYCIDEECNYKFPIVSKITGSAGTEELIKRQAIDINEYDVTRVHATMQRNKADTADMLVVNYFCGNKHYRTFLGFGTVGLLRMKAVRWWRKHHPDDPPDETQEAYDRFSECRTAERIRVQEGSEWPEIMEYMF